MIPSLDARVMPTTPEAWSGPRCPRTLRRRPVAPWPLPRCPLASFPATWLVGFLVPRPGPEPGPSAVRARSPEPWTAGKPRLACSMTEGRPSGVLDDGREAERGPQRASLTAGGWLIPGTSTLCPPATPHPQFGGPLSLPSTHGCERYPALRSHRPAPYPTPYAHRNSSPSKSRAEAEGGRGWDAGKTSGKGEAVGERPGSRLLTGSRGTFCVHVAAGSTTETSRPGASGLNVSATA